MSEHAPHGDRHGAAAAAEMEYLLLAPVWGAISACWIWNGRIER
jgi:hypothetical protein